MTAANSAILAAIFFAMSVVRFLSNAKIKVKKGEAQASPQYYNNMITSG